jgi:hypothetical protein
MRKRKELSLRRQLWHKYFEWKDKGKSRRFLNKVLDVIGGLDV